MPMVGGKEFPYTEKGKEDAKKAKERLAENAKASAKRTQENAVNSRKLQPGTSPEAMNRSIKSRFMAEGNYAGKKPRRGDAAESKRMMDAKKSALKGRLKSKGMK